METQSTEDSLQIALDILAHIVAQANVNAIDGEDGFIERYSLPVGAIHKAIPFLARHKIYVDEFGGIHTRECRCPNCRRRVVLR